MDVVQMLSVSIQLFCLYVLTYRRRDKGMLVEDLRFYILLLGIQFLEVPLLLGICLLPISL